MEFKHSNKSIIEDIKASANIVDIISRYIKLKKKGGSYFGLCPFHNDTHPSLSVSPSKKIYKCFVCQAGGDVISFVAKKENISYIEAAKRVAEMINYDMSKFNQVDSITTKQYSDKQLRLLDALDRVNTFYYGFLSNRYSMAMDYVKNRNLTDEIIEHFRIGYAPNDENLIKDYLTNKDDIFGNDLPYEKRFNEDELIKAGILSDDLKPIFKNRIIFPIIDENGKIVGFSGRDISNHSSAKYLHNVSTEIFEKSKILYNFYTINKQTTTKVILVEGFMDTIAYWRNGYTDTVATMGTALTDSQIELLKTLPKLETIILSFDNDDAGIDATIRNGRVLIENGFNVSVVNYLNYIEKDVDEIFNKYGKKAIDLIIKNRIDFLMFYINKTLNKDYAIDDKIIKTEEVLKYVAVNATTLQASQYMSLIAKLTDFNIIDIEKKFNEYREDEYKKSQVDLQNSKVYNKKSFSSKKENLDHIDFIEVRNGFTQNLAYSIIKFNKNNNQIIEKLIFNCLIYPENIPLLQSKLHTTGIDFILANLIKIIFYIHIEHKTLSGQDFANKVVELLDERSKVDDQTKINEQTKKTFLQIINTYNGKFYQISKKINCNKQPDFLGLIKKVNENISKIGKLQKSVKADLDAIQDNKK